MNENEGKFYFHDIYFQERKKLIGINIISVIILIVIIKGLMKS